MQGNTQGFRVDLHTHSIISYDGGITAEQYERLLNTGKLDCIAITDHNDISFAKTMQKKLGHAIIVGEEITTKEGEIIGLFLKEAIPADLSLDEAVASIKHQKGLVYIPHPFETFRKGVQSGMLERIRQDVDIIETFNARGFLRGRAKDAESFRQKHSLSGAASSDAHGYAGAGSAFSIIEELPTVDTLVSLLAKGSMHKKYAPGYTFLYPFINKITNRLALTNYR